MSLDNNSLFNEISNLATEQRNKNSTDIDYASTGEILKIINNEAQVADLALSMPLNVHPHSEPRQN